MVGFRLIADFGGCDGWGLRELWERTRGGGLTFVGESGGS